MALQCDEEGRVVCQQSNLELLSFCFTFGSSIVLPFGRQRIVGTGPMSVFA